MNTFCDYFDNDSDWLVPSDQLTVTAISELLAGAGIDHDEPQDESIYAFGLGFPIWIKIIRPSRSIYLSTYSQGAPDVHEVDALQFANLRNDELPLVQFSWSAAYRLEGHYSLPYDAGLPRTQLLRCIQRFAAIFARATMVGIECGILCRPGVGTPEPQFSN